MATSLTSEKLCRTTYKEEDENYNIYEGIHRRILKGAILGSLGGLLAILMVLSASEDILSATASISSDSNSFSNTSRRRSTSQKTTHRRLTETQDASLVIAGKLSVEEGPCNIAQYNLYSGQWSLTERIQLSLYNSYSGGEVYSLLANHTVQNNIMETILRSQQAPSLPDTTSNNIKPAPKQQGSGELIVVGAFDTTYKNSQVTYCSIGKWDGAELSKVGEGLCNSALSKGMKITTAALAGPHDVYIAGSFQTQVWNGDLHEFVKIYNIAHYDAQNQVWMPLNVGQISCSWCTVTVLALAWDAQKRQLHVAGKFNAIDGHNVPAGLAIYDFDSGHLVAHPGGGLTMMNISQDGVGTALSLDEEGRVLYVMGSFQRLTMTNEVCNGLAAYEIDHDRWTCLADAKHTVLPSGGGNMLLTPFGLMVAGKTTATTTWPDDSRPYTIALLNATIKKRVYNWTWLPGFQGHSKPLHALSNGFGPYEGSVFIAGDDYVGKWCYEPVDSSHNYRQTTEWIPTTTNLSKSHVRGSIMSISQMMPPDYENAESSVNLTIIVYCVSVGCVLGVIGAILCNRNISSTVFSFLKPDNEIRGFTLDTLTHSAFDSSALNESYQRALRHRHVHRAPPLSIIDPKDVRMLRTIGNGTFGRVWSAKWRSSSVAVKEFSFAQSCVAGKSLQQKEIVEEIIGEAGMMAILRHPNVLQLFGCSLTAQAIWIVSELCSLGSLRSLLDDNNRILPVQLRLNLALQVAEGMTYLHSQEPPIIHRDLKSHNIFVHETFTNAEDASVSSEKQHRHTFADGDSYERMDTQSTIIAKIGDWGSARASLAGSTKTMTQGVGTACWLAPEVINHARASEYSDVYSFGIILWELATREEVYQGLETMQIIAKVANENLRPPVPMDCPWKDLMVRCWAEVPQDRLKFRDIIEELNQIVQKVDASKIVPE